MNQKRYILLAFASLAGFIHGCASKSDFDVFKNTYVMEPVFPEPDLTLRPQLSKTRPGDIKNRMVSWVGYVTKIEPKADSQGRYVVYVDHRFLAINSGKLEKNRKDISFDVSETGDGTFQCRVQFQKVPGSDDWRDYLDQRRVLACTGKVIGFSEKGRPVIVARKLEAFQVDRVVPLVPETNRDGFIQMDTYGRPSYKSF